jgi:DNA helicase-2/ATP-dependent DNA helicase PcrA
MSIEKKREIAEHYQKRFEKVVRQLNEAQREAVDAIEGPVLVLAGPGTGKTHVLSARIGRILLDTDTAPYNILCLTFTDAGVHAMRKRLLEFIGPEAHRIHIFTFHSFCNKIIQENLDYFGIQDLMPLSEIERVEVLQAILDSQPYTNPLKRGKSNPYYFIPHLEHLFRHIKMEDWRPEQVEKEVNRYLKSLPEREEYRYKRNAGQFQKGDLKEGAFHKEQNRMDLLRAAIALFPEYESLLKKKKRYDYEDMILWVLKAFERYPFLLRRYQEQYLYLLVDEYQDTNGAQNEILHKLISYWDHPNIFIVGDDDQSIYEFQGARLHHLQAFYQRYKEGLQLVVLEENYRSIQEILGYAGKLIGENELRIGQLLPGLTKTLKSRQTEKGRVKIRAYPDRTHEDGAVLRDIRDLLDKNIPSDSIAVLYAQHKQGKNLIELFEKYPLPYQTKRNLNILETSPIRQVLRMLLYFSKEWKAPFEGEEHLVEIMHYPFFQLSSRDIAKLAVLSRSSEHQNWRSMLTDELFLAEAGLSDAAPFIQMGRFVSDYLEWGARQPLSRIVEKSGKPQRTFNLFIGETECLLAYSTPACLLSLCK